ncbi:hypothetical protein IEI94_17305 [Halomonas sp. ML-15]|uniref:hypothetical protein n=1 Tax=Halomonas sp. ML-15 TaxID=2773305 RepID=UPI0017470BA5|nr:hypothetical protein [Halomonas sp. ML-15]MBD3897616.1 hypothetical protein [Halomonas sp. ML-15]
MSNGPYYQGSCECGAVTLLVTDEPLAQGSDDQGNGWLVLDAAAVQVSGGLDALSTEFRDDGHPCSRCHQCRQWLLAEGDELTLIADILLPAEAEPPSPELAERLPWRLY